MSIDPQGFYSTYELGKLLGIGPKSIASRCVRGEIRATRINQKWIIPGTSAIEFLTTASAKQSKQCREVAK